MRSLCSLPLMGHCGHALYSQEHDRRGDKATGPVGFAVIALRVSQSAFGGSVDDRPKQVVARLSTPSLL
jgi:hypothetical protein